jgi:hypothetical protein
MSSTRNPSFEQARDAWRDHWQRKDSGLTATQRVLIGRLHADFNRKHFEKTGDLLAWRGWESITTKAGPSESSILRGFRKLDRRGALEINHGGRNPKTGWKLGNSYKAIMPPPVKLTGGHPSNCPQSTRQDDGRLSDRLSELKDSAESAAGEIIILGNPRGPTAPEEESKPSTDSSKPPFPRSACEVPRPRSGWRDRLDEPPVLTGEERAARDRLAALSKANGSAGAIVVSS